MVYLNGGEAWTHQHADRDIAIAFNTLATTTAADDGTVYFPNNVNPGLLVAGTGNVLAVECPPDRRQTASDISFDLELLANVTQNQPPTLDAIANPAAILEDSGPQTVGLSGIADGGDGPGPITVSAGPQQRQCHPQPNCRL